MKNKKPKEISEFELILASIAAKCAINYSAMGAVGFVYESIKDELKWAGIEPKYYTSLLNRVGNLFVLDDENYEKQKVSNTKMDGNDIATKLLTTFGGSSGV